MRLRWLVLFALMVGSLATPNPVAARQPRSCGPASAKTIAHSARARVYLQYVRRDHSHEVFGCLDRGGRSFVLGPHDLGSAGRDFVSIVALNAPFAAVNEEMISGTSGILAEVSVVDLRDGRRVHRWTRAGDSCLGAPHIAALTVSGRGSAAWIADIETSGPNGAGCGPDTYEVWKVEDHSRARLLDSSSGIDAHYLAHRHGHVYWRDGGTVHSAPLQ